MEEGRRWEKEEEFKYLSFQLHANKHASSFNSSPEHLFVVILRQGLTV
jgi:hypothetical protein